jgi:hypothetical protein
MFIDCKYVALLKIGGEEVARGVAQKVNIGSILGGHPIQVIDEIVLIQSIKDESAYDT